MPATECEALAKSTTANAAGRRSAAQGKRAPTCLLRDSAVPRQRANSYAGGVLSEHKPLHHHVQIRSQHRQCVAGYGGLLCA